MKKRKLIIAEQAIEDLTDIWLYIASDSIRNADRFIDFFYEKCFSLCDTPEIGRERPELQHSLIAFKKYNTKSTKQIR